MERLIAVDHVGGRALNGRLRHVLKTRCHARGRKVRQLTDRPSYVMDRLCQNALLRGEIRRSRLRNFSMGKIEGRPMCPQV